MGGPYAEHGFGLDVDLTSYAVRLTPYEVLFGETQARAVVTCAPDRVPAVVALAAELGVPVHRAGTVSAPDGVFRVTWRDAHIARPVTGLRRVYYEAIPRRKALVAQRPVADPAVEVRLPCQAEVSTMSPDVLSAMSPAAQIISATLTSGGPQSLLLEAAGRDLLLKSWPAAAEAGRASPNCP